MDTHLEADHNDIVVASLDNGFTVKRLTRRGETWWLMPANPQFQPDEVQETDDIRIWGGIVPAKLKALLNARD